MTEQGIDYSFARPGGAAIKAAGKSFAMRYVPYQGDGGKGLTVTEMADLQANGIAIGLVFESTAGRPQGGRDAGLGDGVLARQGARGIGWPETLPIYFAVDYDASDFAPIDAYLLACRESLGAQRVGVYGSFAVIEHCHTSGSAAWYWQTYAWSQGQKSSWRHVYQYENGQTLNGGAVDYCEIYGEAGLWKVEPQEEELPMSALQDIADLKAIVIANGFDAVPRPGTEDLFPPGTVIIPEGQDGGTVRLTGDAALQYAVRRGFSLALALELNVQADAART